MNWRLFAAALVFFIPETVSVDAAQAQGAPCIATGCDGIVTDFYVNGSGLLLRTDLDENTLNCQLYQGIYMVLDKNHANYDSIYASLLTHYMAEKKIFIRINEGSSNCSVFYVRSQR